MPENTAGVAGQSGVGGAGQSGAAAAAGPSGEATGEDDVAGPSTAKRQRVITDPALALQRVEGLMVPKKGRPRALPDSVRINAAHYPDNVPATATDPSPKRECTVCGRKKRADGSRFRSRTRIQCTVCDVGLCISPCFGIFHTVRDF